MPLKDVVLAYFYGIRLDISTTGYIAIIPFLIWFIHSLLPTRFWKGFITIYSAFMLLLVAVITTSDLEIYKIWGTKLNAQAVGYLKYPKEAMASVSSSPLLLLVLICTLLFLVGYYLFVSSMKQISFKPQPISILILIARFAIFILLGGVIFLAIRGGTGLAPMNPGFAYFSNRQFANHAALNSSWNLMYDLKHFFRHKNNQFKYMSNSEMNERVGRLMKDDVATENREILSTTRPNIVLIILESWSADIIAQLGGEKGVTPFFDELANNGLLFTNFYANGYRTSFGVAAVLSGFPSTPEGSILNRPNKMERLPTLPGTLKASGYKTSFYYGGDTHFDDMNAFFVHSKFDSIIDKSSFKAEDMNSKWGVHDHVLFERVISDLSKRSEPFFTAMLTISSHEPFEVPMKTVYQGDNPQALFKNAIHYKYRSLRTFMEKARTESWYKNTLFVFVADHGSGILSKSKESFMPVRYKIPLLFYGEVVNREYQGYKSDVTGSQTDIAATLLAQMHINSNIFKWSNNLLNSKRYDFAYYNFAGGFGFITPQERVAFDTVSNKTLTKNDSPETLKNGEAYLQNLYQKYSLY